MHEAVAKIIDEKSAGFATLSSVLKSSPDKFCCNQETLRQFSY